MNYMDLIEKERALKNPKEYLEGYSIYRLLERKQNNTK